MPVYDRVGLVLVCAGWHSSSISLGGGWVAVPLCTQVPKNFEKFLMFFDGKSRQVRREPKRAILRRVSITTARTVNGRAAQRCVFSVVASNRTSIGLAIEKARRTPASERCDLLLT